MLFIFIKFEENIICHIGEVYGLCFCGCLAFFDYFMTKKDNQNIKKSIKEHFNGFEDKYEMNGGQNYFKCDELEVFQLLNI